MNDPAVPETVTGSSDQCPNLATGDPAVVFRRLFDANAVRLHRVRTACRPVAAVAAVVAGALFAQTLQFGDRPAASAEAAAVLDHAAAASIGAVDQPVGPGQYRYIVTRACLGCSSETSRANASGCRATSPPPKPTAWK